MLTAVTRFIERRPALHRLALRVWRLFPPRLAGFMKGVMARSWLVGAVAVMIDEDASPPEVLLVEHSYRPKGAWGLPGGALESISGDPNVEHESSPDDVIETALRREVWEELGIEVGDVRLLRVDAIPFIREEPGPYRLDFYYRCTPEGGFGTLRAGLESGAVVPRSPEISQIKLVPISALDSYDLFSPDARLLSNDLARLAPDIAKDAAVT